MKNPPWINLIGITFALAATAGSTIAQPGPRTRDHYTASAARVRRHKRILANRQTRVYYVRRTRGLPARRDRVYFATIADARAAGYQPARRDTVPIDPRLTWRSRRDLPSLGTHREPNPPPKSIQKPTAPPRTQQPHVTPTQPMPN